MLRVRLEEWARLGARTRTNITIKIRSMIGSLRGKRWLLLLRLRLWRRMGEDNRLVIK